MSIVFVPEKFHSEKKNQDFYVVKIAYAKDGIVLRKSQPILWLTAEQYEDFTKSSQN